MQMSVVDDRLAEIPLLADGTPAGGLGLGAGWHGLEQPHAEAYRWTAPDFEIHLDTLAECLVLDCARGDMIGPADCLVSGPQGWVELPAATARGKLVVELAQVIAGPGVLRFSLSKSSRVAGDDRAFGLCVFQVRLANGVEANRARLDKAETELPSTVRHLPTEFSIASSDRCNLRCVMCGAHHAQSGDNNAGREDLRGALVRKIAPLSGGAESIQLHGGGGEPLFNPEFWQLVDGFANVPGRNVEIHTNGLLFTPRNIVRMIESSITHVSLSFDAASEEMYRNIRGADFNKLVANVRRLVAARAVSGRTDLRISANMTVFQANVTEAVGLVELADELGLDTVMLMHLNAGDGYDWVEKKPDGWTFDYRANLPEQDPHHIQRHVEIAVARAAELGLDLLVDPRLRAMEATVAEAPAEAPPPPVEAAVAPEPEPTPITVAPEPAEIPAAPPVEAAAVAAEPAAEPVQEAAAPAAEPAAVDENLRYRECRKPWRWLNIAVNGDVHPCCWSAKPLGNLNEVESLEEIWNGRRMRELRTSIKENRLDSDVCIGASCLYVTYGSAEG